MTRIRTFPFKKEGLQRLREYHFGLNWPVVYIQEDGKEMYIGQTTDALSRSRQHMRKPEHAKLKRVHVLTDEEFNMSTAFDFESLLIQYVAAEGKYKLMNGNGGLINHNYYDRQKYLAKLETIWSELRKIGLVSNDLDTIRNTDYFKYSPYKALTEDQLAIAEDLIDALKSGTAQTHIVNGRPGTGKSILALYLLKYLASDDEWQGKKIAIVISMTSLRATLQKVVARVPGLSRSMIIGPSDVAKSTYDLLIVDESHRLRRRVNVPNYGPYDKTNKVLGLQEDATQLDWLKLRSKSQIFFYDKQQNVMPGDVRAQDFAKLGATQHELISQMRVEGGNAYLEFIDCLFGSKKATAVDPDKYDFRIYDNINEMRAAIFAKDRQYSLSRMLAGYAWEWVTKEGRGGYDIDLDGLKLRWNGTNSDWVNSKNSLQEVGCIHTIQGYDLNYAGVIIGPEISYDAVSKQIVVDKKKYRDKNGRNTVSDPEELRQYVINIYKTLLTRGIKGTYIYICDPSLKAHFVSLIGRNEPILSPITVEMVQVPLVGSAPCGDPLLGETNIEEYIPVDKKKIKSGFKYFILRAEGDSMNKVGINDGDLVLCRQQEKADTGDRVVALLGDNVTIKEYGARVNGIRKLLPRSSNPHHTPITPGEGDSVQGIVQEVLEKTYA